MLKTLTLCLASLLWQLPALADEPFVPDDFVVPDGLETDRFRIRALTIHDAVKDYDAVMSSLDYLQDTFLDQWGWPPSDLTLQQDLIDLGWHHKEFQRRTSFAYTVVTLDESRVVGCLYIFPFGISEYDAEVTMWVRSDTLKSGLDQALYQAVRSWIEEDWPFDKVAYPGREMSWDAYNALNESN